MHGAYGASAVGRFPEMLKMGIRVCLGCDAAANNNALDVFREMRTTPRASTRTRAWMRA
jgi:cytosine/adenosine deaminase-related metal-dependent hydrolase